MSHAALTSYHRTVQATATPSELLLALYDGALRFVARAEACLEARDYAGKGAAIGRALAILTELTCALDGDAAPELASQLTPLYLYLSRRLEEASRTLTTAPLAEVKGHLQSLRATWAEAIATL